jgi:hypothetical protein
MRKPAREQGRDQDVEHYALAYARASASATSVFGSVLDPGKEASRFGVVRDDLQKSL